MRAARCASTTACHGGQPLRYRGVASGQWSAYWLSVAKRGVLMTRIAAVLGSVTPPGRLTTAVSGAMARAASRGAEVNLIDLGKLRLDFADGRPPDQHDDDSARVIETVAAADAVLLATPVYRGTFTGALKNLLDLLPVEMLQSKPVGLVSMGATQHHH